MRTDALRRPLLLLAALALALTTACSSTSGTEPTEPQAPIPASSPLAKIEQGMTDSQVRAILGEPDGAHSYVTGKSWIPFYYGPDTSRMEWRYAGKGLITFSRNAYSGSLKVVRVVYDPKQKAN